MADKAETGQAEAEEKGGALHKYAALSPQGVLLFGWSPLEREPLREHAARTGEWLFEVAALNPAPNARPVAFLDFGVPLGWAVGHAPEDKAFDDAVFAQAFAEEPAKPDLSFRG